MRLSPLVLSVFLIASPGGPARADYKDDIGYTLLQSELGTGTPDGSGIQVTQAEASSGGSGNPPVYLPDLTNAQFSGKTILDESNDTSGAFSGHATSVGGRFYGNTSSIAPGITIIQAYYAGHWLEDGYLRGGKRFKKPRSTPGRVGNHSWVGSSSDPNDTSDLLRRLDWVIGTDEFVHVAGLVNGGTNQPLLSSAFNIIAVGRSDASHGMGSVAVDTDYTAGRSKPDLVAPQTTTSAATPVIAAAAALLMDTGHGNPALSTDPEETSTSNRNGDILYNAERSETVRAALMAGADRATANTSSVDLIAYRIDPANQTGNGLDRRYGAGQVNIYNSYHIIAAGEQNSSEDGGAGSTGIAASGFDYDPAFGGSGSSNITASYTFSTGTDTLQLAASLIWNIDIDGGNRFSFSGDARLHDLDLFLYDVTGSRLLVASSASSNENTENLWLTLDTQRNYRLEVTPKAGQGNFSHDYALAWHIAPPPDSDSDGITNAQDNCPATPNPDQLDTDGDMQGDACDTDDDNDGLADGLESAIGTDPLDVDSDGDGLDDYTEVNWDGDPEDYDPLNDLDPLSADTDGDWLDDFAELNYDGDPAYTPGLDPDPLSHDSDGDSFPDGTEVAADYNPLNGSPPNFPVWGDINNDRQVDTADVLLASRAALGLISLDNMQLARGNVAPLVGGQPRSAPDDQFNVADLLIIQRFALD